MAKNPFEGVFRYEKPRKMPKGKKTALKTGRAATEAAPVKIREIHTELGSGRTTQSGWYGLEDLGWVLKLKGPHNPGKVEAK